MKPCREPPGFARSVGSRLDLHSRLRGHKTNCFAICFCSRLIELCIKSMGEAHVLRRLKSPLRRKNKSLGSCKEIVLVSYIYTDGIEPTSCRLCEGRVATASESLSKCRDDVVRANTVIYYIFERIDHVDCR